MFAVEYSKQAARSLKAMPRPVVATIRSKIERLAVDPYTSGNDVKSSKVSQATG